MSLPSVFSTQGSQGQSPLDGGGTLQLLMYLARLMNINPWGTAISNLVQSGALGQAAKDQGIPEAQASAAIAQANAVQAAAKLFDEIHAPPSYEQNNFGHWEIKEIGKDSAGKTLTKRVWVPSDPKDMWQNTGRPQWKAPEMTEDDYNQFLVNPKGAAFRWRRDRAERERMIERGRGWNTMDPTPSTPVERAQIQAAQAGGTLSGFNNPYNYDDPMFGPIQYGGTAEGRNFNFTGERRPYKE